MSDTSKKHGGSRAGAGRKTKYEKTVVMRQRVFFVSNERAGFCYVNRSKTVTNLQGVMEVYCLDQVSEIFAKSA